MAKKLIFFVFFLFCFVCSPAYAWDVYVGEDVPVNDSFQLVAPDGSVANGSTEGATTESILGYEIMPMSNYTQYIDGFPSSSYIDWAKGFLPYVKPTEDYVFARTGQYQYIMAIGDFENGFSGSATVHVLNLAQYNNQYSYIIYDDENFVLNVGQGLVYSSVAPYPTLTAEDFSGSLLFLGAFIICFLFVSWIASHAFMSLFEFRR